MGKDREKEEDPIPEAVEVGMEASFVGELGISMVDTDVDGIDMDGVLLMGLELEFEMVEVEKVVEDIPSWNRRGNR